MAAVSASRPTVHQPGGMGSTRHERDETQTRIRAVVRCKHARNRRASHSSLAARFRHPRPRPVPRQIPPLAAGVIPTDQLGDPLPSRGSAPPGHCPLPAWERDAWPSDSPRMAGNWYRPAKIARFDCWNPDDGKEVRRIVARVTNFTLSRTALSSRPRWASPVKNLGRPDRRRRADDRSADIDDAPDFHTAKPLAFAPDGSTLAMVSGKRHSTDPVATGEERLRLAIRAATCDVSLQRRRKQLVAANGQIGGTLRAWNYPGARRSPRHRSEDRP